MIPLTVILFLLQAIRGELSQFIDDMIVQESLIQ